MPEGVIPNYVFLDTETYIRFAYQYASTPFKSIKDLIERDILTLVITR